MEYSETGNFSKEHRALCKKIRELINAAKKKDLVFKINKNKLCAYLMPELELAADEKANDLKDYDYKYVQTDENMTKAKKCFVSLQILWYNGIS